MDEHFNTLLDRHEKILQEELPTAKDPEARQRLRTNLGIVFDRMVKRYYGDEMKDQLIALYDGWDRFPAAPPPTGRDDPPLEDQFIGTLLEVLTQKLTQAQVGAVAASEATVPPVAPATPPQQRRGPDSEEVAPPAAEPDPEKRKAADSNP
jgi:hypothetical protein